jgi:hypothetical protein
MIGIDVAIPNYQYGRYLRQAVSSVLSQDVQGLRVLIIDNASTDNSFQVASELASVDSRVQVLAHPTNLGYLKSMNDAIDWASSKYFLILCADDLLAHGWLAKAMAVMEENSEVVLAFGQTLFFTTDQAPRCVREPQPDAPWQITKGWQFIEDNCRHPIQRKSANLVVVRTSAQKQAGYYRIEHTSDYEMMLRIGVLGSVAETEVVQGYWRKHASNLSNDLTPTTRLRSIAKVYESFFAHEGSIIPKAETLNRIAHRNIGLWCCRACMGQLLRGNLEQCASLFKFAFSLLLRGASLKPIENISKNSP